MSRWEGPGFVDAHAHVLRVAAGAIGPCDVADPESVAAYHREMEARGISPMDDPRPIPIERRDEATLAAALQEGLEGAARMGLVEVWEAGMDDWAYLDALLRLRERGPLPARVRILVASAIADPRDGRMRRTGDEWVEVAGVKLYADGWLGSRTCALRQPFADRPDDDGILFLSADKLARRAAPFVEAGWIVATHAIGDRAIETVLDAYERILAGQSATTIAAPPRVEHAQVLHPDLIDRVAGLGVVVCIQPSFAVSDAAMAAVALGPTRFTTAYRWDQLLAAGVRVVAGSDHPIETLSPLIGLQRLVTGADVEEGREPVVTPIPLDDALALMTDPAAGVTVLDVDPRDVAPEELHELSVEATVPGRVTDKERA